MAEIRLEHVTRVFRGERIPLAGRRDEGATVADGPVAALDDLSFTAPEGKTVAVIGPSGCGKSTLLRVIAGLDQEYQGAVYYNGLEMRDTPPRDRYIGMVFQNYALYPHFYGHGNLSFFFRMHKAPDKEAEARIRETAEMMGFGFRQLLGRKPDAVRRGTAASCDCAGDGAQAGAVSARRAAFQPRCQAAPQTRRDQAAAEPFRHHVHLCDP